MRFVRIFHITATQIRPKSIAFGDVVFKKKSTTMRVVKRKPAKLP